MSRLMIEQHICGEQILEKPIWRQTHESPVYTMDYSDSAETNGGNTDKIIVIIAVGSSSIDVKSAPLAAIYVEKK